MVAMSRKGQPGGRAGRAGREGGREGWRVGEGPARRGVEAGLVGLAPLRVAGPGPGEPRGNRSRRAGASQGAIRSALSALAAPPALLPRAGPGGPLGPRVARRSPRISREIETAGRGGPGPAGSLRLWPSVLSRFPSRKRPASRGETRRPGGVAPGAAAPKSVVTREVGMRSFKHVPCDTYDVFDREFLS